MNDPTQKNSTDYHALRHDEPDIEVLIGRVIDGEATAEDRQRFESQAEIDPQLWRRLAMRQHDMAALHAKVARLLDSSERVDLPGESVLALRAPWIVAIAGWAAVIGIAIVWAFTSLNGRKVDDPGAVIRAADPGDLSPDEHLRRYLEAPFVLGELPPTLLDVQELRDGRKAVRFLRRIEEVAFIPADEVLPIDENGELAQPPEELREHTPAMPHQD